MKKYLVIGNPIDHSLSPKLHNYWIKENNIDAIYDKALLNKDDIKSTVQEVANGKIDGINVTLPFKKAVIPFVDELTPTAKQTQSVNTIFKKDNKIIGENTDSDGFKKALEYTKYKVKNKSALILGAGGVVSSIILALKKLSISKIFLSNRTKKSAEDIKKFYPDLEIIDWGETRDSDIIINATSLGLKRNDIIELDFEKMGKNKLFYDLIYNPSKTDFLIRGEKSKNQIENGKMMFVYQAQLSFGIWHKIEPVVDKKVLEILKND